MSSQTLLLLALVHDMRAGELNKWLKMVFIRLLGFGGSFRLRVYSSFSRSTLAFLERAYVPQPPEGQADHGCVRLNDCWNCSTADAQRLGLQNWPSRTFVSVSSVRMKR